MRRKLTKGMHTFKLSRRGPLPHLVALCFATKTPFPKDWRPPQHTVRDIGSIPAEHRKAFQRADGGRTAFIGQEINFRRQFNLLSTIFIKSRPAV